MLICVQHFYCSIQGNPRRLHETADLVLLALEGGGVQACGRASAPQEFYPHSADNFYAFIDLRCWPGGVAHELGHNLGALHDFGREVPRKGRYNYGYLLPGTSKRTVMS